MFEQANEGGRVWFLAAPSRGFGVEMARQLLASGNEVVAAGGMGLKALACLPEAGGRLQLLTIDDSETTQVEAAVEAAIRRFGRIDCLVTSASEGLLGAIEEASDAEVLHAVDASVLGVWRYIRAVLPTMRANRFGRIVNLTPTALSAAGWGVFAAIRSAIESLSDSLADEVEPLGISVTSVQPVPFRADLPSGGLIVARTRIDDYYDTAGRARRNYGLGPTTSVSDPVTGVTAIVTAVLGDHPPRHLALGHDGFYNTLKALETRRDEHLAWRDLSLAVDHIV